MEENKLVKILENLDKDDRYKIFEKYKQDLKHILARTPFKALEFRKSHLSDYTILELIYLNREEAIDFIIQLLAQKIQFLKESIDYLQNNKQQILAEIDKVMNMYESEKLKVYKQTKEYEQQQ